MLITHSYASIFTDCPQLGTAGTGANRTVFSSGANGTFPVGERQWGKRDERESSWKNRDEYRGGEREQGRRGSEREHGIDRRRDYRRRSRSRSRDRVRRRPSRSRSIEPETRDRDKRRRIE